MALYVTFECESCENENCTGKGLKSTVYKCGGYKHKQTNADRIRAMNDEELAEMFLTHDEQLYRHCPSDTFAEYCQVKPFVECCDCKACWVDWLKQEAEEGE